MIPKYKPHNRIKDTKKRAMNAVERFHVKRLVNMGCLVCRSAACYHHEKLCPGAKRDHRYGAPLCPTHHQYGPKARHNMSREDFNEMLGFDLLQWAKDQWSITEELWRNENEN